MILRRLRRNFKTNDMKKVMMVFAVCMMMTACEKAILPEGVDENEPSASSDIPTKKFTFTVKGDFGSPVFQDGGTTRSVTYLTNESNQMTDLWVFDFVGDECVQTIHQTTSDEAWGQPQMNTTVEHRKLTLDKEVFRYGIGSHAPAFIRYSLPRSYSTLHATVGLDDESACGDGASFIVMGDNRELFRSKRLYSTEKQNINVDVSGVKVLELRLDEGDKKDKDCDHGDWANVWLEAAR